MPTTPRPAIRIADNVDFLSWEGNLQGCTTSGPLIDVVMSLPREIMAVFYLNLAPLGTPEWWLATHGFTNDIAQAEAEDPDEDQMLNWQEYVADTHPTDSNSVLAVQGLLSRQDGNLVQWQGGVAATYAGAAPRGRLDASSGPGAGVPPQSCSYSSSYPSSAFREEEKEEEDE